MTKTPEQMAEEFAEHFAGERRKTIAKKSWWTGYQAAKDQLADADKVITYDYVETARNDAKELIAKYELEGDKDMLIKALVAAYCTGVDAVDGYLRNSLSAYRNSVKRLQWISVKERLPEEGEEIFWCHAPTCEMVVGQLVGPTPYFTHWMPLPEPPEKE